MKRVFFALVSLAALAGTAAAADLAASGAGALFKAPICTPVYNWTGFYIGLNGGGGWGRSSWDRPAALTSPAASLAAPLGYNYQFGQGVVGLEGDVDWSDINGTTSTICPLGCTTSDNWLSTVRGRLGYAADRFMPYITGGAAFGDISASTPGFAGASTTKAGWTVGAGLEVAIVGNWTAKAEYLYVDLGNFNCGLACGARHDRQRVVHANIVRGGVNYRF